MNPNVETTKMSTRGQVIIPKETREFTGSSENTIFKVFPIDNKTSVLRKLDKQKVVEEFRALRAKTKNKLSEAAVNEIVHKAR